jgi:hypothetical protein
MDGASTPWLTMGTLAEIRDDYVRRFRAKARAEADHFSVGSLAQRVRAAAWARKANGRKHKHQWRIPNAFLTRFGERLVARLPAIGRVRSFAALLQVVESASFKGIGELTVYDTAVRIGSGQGMEPDCVYLHAGTRIGAARLGLDIRRDSIPMSEIPIGLAGLSPSEIEDLFCSYADCFGSASEKLSGRDCGSTLPAGCSPGRPAPKGC